ERMKSCQAKVLDFAETAMALSLAGDPTAAVKNLILHGRNTLNARLIDNAYQVLQKHGAKINGADALSETVQALRKDFGLSAAKPSLGEQKRQAGGLALRTGSRPTVVAPRKPA
ncbi:MAG: response regulator, partial [Rhodoferax sp.]|nr:response regulator [Rhodoferax sp.]